MAVPPAGTRRTSRSGSAGAASARGLSQQMVTVSAEFDFHNNNDSYITKNCSMEVVKLRL